MEKVFKSRFTEDYIFEDLSFVNDRGVKIHPNEIELLTSRNLSPELQDRLGLIMVNRPQSSGSDNPDRYNQSLLGKQSAVERSLDDLDTQFKEIEEMNKVNNDSE